MEQAPPRPLIHFTAEHGWINDPLGMTYRDDVYHLFFQYVPDSLEWQPHCHWGHAVSSDLVTWTEREIALAPGDGDGGVWSGSVIDHPDHGPLLFYTSVAISDVAIGTVRVANPTDHTWDQWSKGDVVVVAPDDLEARAFRDPYVFRDVETWRMLVGTSLADGTAAAASFSSKDCLRWDFDGLAAERPCTVREPVWTGSLWECPQVFEIDGNHVMVTSVWEDDVLHYAAYAVGSYHDGVFEASSWHRLTFGDSYYAPSFFRDSEGAPCLILWLRGPGGEESGWKGALSIPQRISFRDGLLRCEPHPVALEALRRELPRSPQGVRVIAWEPREGPVTITRAGAEELILEEEAGEIHARTSSCRYRISLSETPEAVMIIVDGTVCEVYLGEAVFALG